MGIRRWQERLEQREAIEARDEKARTRCSPGYRPAPEDGDGHTGQRTGDGRRERDREMVHDVRLRAIGSTSVVNMAFLLGRQFRIAEPIEDEGAGQGEGADHGEGYMGVILPGSTARTGFAPSFSRGQNCTSRNETPQSGSRGVTHA